MIWTKEYAKKYNREYQKKWYHKNIEVLRKRHNEWAKNNLEKMREYRRRYIGKMEMERPKEYERFLEKNRKISKRYRDNNKEKIREKRMKKYWGGHKKRERRPNGDGWDKMRLKALDRDNHKCRFCGEEANEVHHLDETGSNRPEKMKNHKLGNLITLCHKCHIDIHDTKGTGFGKGKWEAEEERNEEIYSLLGKITQTQIAKMYGITRQRVHQIIRRYEKKLL